MAYDAIVIGAGAVGGSTACHLAKQGMRVCVIDAAGVASGATGASEGLVGSITKRKSGPVTDIVTKSWRMFPTLADELGDFEFRRKPGLMVIDKEEHVDLLRRFADKRRAEGLRIEWLDRRQVREEEPLLGEHILGGLLTPDQGMVDPIKLTHAYLNYGKARGAEVKTGARVVRLDRLGERVIRVVTTKGTFASDIVVNAAGAAAGQIGGSAQSGIEITPKRAQMLVSEAIAPGTLRNTIYAGANVAAGLDLRTLEFEDMPNDEERRRSEITSPWQLSSFTQTIRGNILFCGGFGFVGATREADPLTLARMAANIRHVIPSFATLRMIRGWAGLEPCTPNNVPVIGAAESSRNLFHAAGHGNAGVMMSPFTGAMLADIVQNRETAASSTLQSRS